MPIYMRGIIDHALDQIRANDVSPPAAPANPFLTPGGAPNAHIDTGPVNELIGLLFGSPNGDAQSLGAPEAPPVPPTHVTFPEQALAHLTGVPGHLPDWLLG